MRSAKPPTLRSRSWHLRPRLWRALLMPATQTLTWRSLVPLERREHSLVAGPCPKVATTSAPRLKSETRVASPSRTLRSKATRSCRQHPGKAVPREALFVL
eukprot:Amastigsp_a511658_9.p3 type:complete len:101 gc:universal Amastigsp_a511658_9:395-93(-)